MAKRISLIILILFYIGAGINHFWHQVSYMRIIPGYFPYPDLLNYIAGSAEILFGLLLISPKTRKFGAYGIVLLLIAFIPVHIYDKSRLVYGCRLLLPGMGHLAAVISATIYFDVVGLVA